MVVIMSAVCLLFLIAAMACLVKAGKELIGLIKDILNE